MPTSAPKPLLRVLTLSLLVLTGPVAAAPATDTQLNTGQLDPARVGWSEIRMTATKLFLTADARLRQATVPAQRIVPELLPVPEGRPIAPGDEVLQLIYEAGGVGHRTRVDLWMDPRSGAAIQRTQHDLQGRLRHRTYRFTDIGAYQRTRWPSGDEASLPPEKWTQTSEGFRAYPPGAAGRIVVEPTGLLYAVAAAALDKPGDRADFWIFRRRNVQHVRIEVLPPREIRVNYDERWPSGSIRRSGKVRPLRLVLRGETEPGAEEEELELLGLHGQLELCMDAETRTPLQLAGDVKIIGQVTLRLTAVQLR